MLNNVIILLPKENEGLKQEVERLLANGMTRLKGKARQRASESKEQPTQDNWPKMVKKFENGATMTRLMPTRRPQVI